MGHRLSFDLDLFTSEKEIVLSFSKEVEEKFKKGGFSVKVVRRLNAFSEFVVNKWDESTKIHLSVESPFKFKKPIDNEFGISVNSYKDIIIDKFLTVFGRTEPRDVVDLFFILKKENFWNLVKLAIEKEPGFDLYWMAITLEKVKNFPDEIEEWPVQMIKKIKPAEIKLKFLSLANEILKKIEKN